MDSEIKTDKSGNLAALISFCVNSSKFGSNYKRNKFYRGLYGWKQAVKKSGKKYVYHRKGILDRIPNIKVDKSVYIVSLKEIEKIRSYMEEWGDKIDYKIFRVLLEADTFKKISSQKDEDRGEWTEIPVK